MTNEEIKGLQDWINSLSGDAKEGALAALQAILTSRQGGSGGSFPPPSEIEIDPDLLDPESNSDDTEPNDIEIDDPDNVLKDKKETEGESEESGENEESSEESEKGEESEDGKPSGEKSDEGDGEPSEGEEPDEGEEYNPDEALATDMDEEESKKIEAQNRRLEIARALNNVRSAIAKNSSDGDAVLTEAIDEVEMGELKDLEGILSGLWDDQDQIDNMTNDEFNALMKRVMDALDKSGMNIGKIKKSDIEAGVSKMSQSFEDTLENDEIDSEDNINKMGDPSYRKKLALDAEKEKLKRDLDAARNGKISGGMAQFKKDLEFAIGNQIAEAQKEVIEQTWAREDRRHSDDGIASPGERVDDEVALDEEHRPEIDIYIDQSGSWSNSQIEIAMAAIQDILKLEKEELLTTHIYYFGRYLCDNAKEARRFGGQECWDRIIQNIKAAPISKNVILVTDTDIGIDWNVDGCHGSDRSEAPTAKVPGCVWFLWKYGTRVVSAVQKLRGEKGTFEYNLNA